ncbi:MAG TPA: DUF732 domain-containing protein [Mycobacterium sp.]|nr:DUF732 domain-containing protein [Mycobacterium sp.]HTX97578.1 DUF732 domain-containing protein [Mycobacterium sp.]
MRWAGPFGALLVLLAPVSVAHADSRDTDFANDLAARGINLGTAAQAGDMARVMCQDLDLGLSPADEVRQMTDHGVAQPQAEFFVAAATAKYCAWQRSG